MSNLKLTMLIDAKTGQVKTAVGGVVHDIKSIGSAADAAGKKTGNFNSKTRAGVESISKQLSLARAQLIGFFAADKAVDMVRGLVSMADGWRSMSAQLRVNTNDVTNVAAMQQEVYKIAQATGAQLEATGRTYGKINRVVEAYGGGLQQTSVITQALNDALKINKADTSEAAAAQLQFAQALGSGVIRGDEFNSLMENATPLMMALAKELGVSAGELRDMAEEGMLTADRVLPAIMRASKDLADTSAQMGLSIPAAWGKIVNATQKWLGKTDEVYGATAGLSNGLSVMADNMETVLGVALRLGQVGLALLARKIIMARLGFLSAAAANTTFITTMVAGEKAGTAMGRSMLLLGKALKLALPVFIVYEFFKALWDNSETARKAMRTLVTAFKNGWERIKFGAKVAGLGIKAAFKGAFNSVREFYAAMISKIAAGFDLIGGDKMAGKLKGLADAIRPGVSAADELKAAVTDAYDDMTQSIALNNAELEEALNADHAEFKAKKGLGEQTRRNKDELNKLSEAMTFTTKKTKDQIKEEKAAAKERARLAKETGKLTAEELKAAQAHEKHKAAVMLQIDKINDMAEAFGASVGVTEVLTAATDDLIERAWELGLSEEQLAAMMNETTGASIKHAEQIAKDAWKVKEVAGPVAKAWQEAGKRIDESFSNAFKNGFRDMKSFGKNLVSSLKDTLAEMMYQLAKSKFFETIQSMGKSGGLMGSLSSLVPSSAGASGGGVGVPGIPGGGMMSGTFGNASYGGIAAGGLGGYALGRLIDVGRSDIGGGLGGAAGMILGGPIGGAIGSALGAAVGSLFGQKYKTTSSGIELGYSGGEVSGQSYEDQRKKRLFGGNKYRTLYDDLDSNLNNYVSSAISNIEAGLIELTGRMGTDARAVLDEFTIERSKLNLSGLSEEEVTAKINGWIADTGAQLMAAVIPEFGGIIRAAGDQAGELLQPLLQLGQYISADFAPTMAATLQQANDTTLQGVMEAVVALESRGVTEGQVLGLTQDLAAKAQTRYQFEVDLLNQIATVRASVSATLDGFKEQVFRETATQQQLADHYLQARNDAFAALKEATDPAEINRLTKEAISAAQQGFALASAEEKQALANSMNQFANDVARESETRLAMVERETLDTHRTTAQIVSDALSRASQNQDMAAANLNTAAQSLNNAAASLNGAAANSGGSYYSPSYPEWALV